MSKLLYIMVCEFRENLKGKRTRPAIVRKYHTHVGLLFVLSMKNAILYEIDMFCRYYIICECIILRCEVVMIRCQSVKYFHFIANVKSTVDYPYDLLTYV